MAEESENVGGINIEASVSDAKVDAGLAALLAKIESAAKQISGALVITPNIAQGANVQRQVQQSTQLTFGGKARGAATAAESTALERAIAAALAKEGQHTATVAAGALKKGRESTNLTIEQALTQSVGGQAPTAIPVQLDTDQFMQQFAAFLTELKGMVGQASQVAQVDVGDGGGGGGKGGLRRKNIRDRGIGTEAPANRVYTYDPAVYQEEEARREAQAAQSRERILSQRRAPAISNAERRFLDTLEKSQQQNSRFSPEMQRELRELSYENQQAGHTGRTSATFSQGASPAQIRAAREAEQRRSNQAPLTAEEKAVLSARTERQNQLLRADARAGFSQTAAAGGRGGGGGGGRGPAVQPSPEDRESQLQGRLAVAEAQRLTAARTARTFASGIGGFLPFIGQTRQQTEATLRLRRAEQEVVEAQRRLGSPEVLGNARAQKAATEELVVAEQNRAKALADVEKFTGGASAAKTLLAVTAAGAAFGIGLKAVDFAIAGVSKGFENFIDIQTGFVVTSSRVTNALAAQTLAAHGNVESVLAQTEAYAGLSASAADAINDQIKLTTQIKAGALAQQQASDLFRAAAGAGGNQTGLNGGFGGLFGTSLFAQQLGGGRGLSEIIQEDISALSDKRGQSPLSNVGAGLSYVTNEDFRNTINDLAKQQGKIPPSDIFEATLRSTPGLGNLLNIVAPQQPAGGGNVLGSLQGPNSLVKAYINDLSAAAERGAPAIKDAAKVTVEYTADTKERAKAEAAAAAAGNGYFVTLAQQAGIVVKVNGQVAATSTELNKALEQIASGKSRIDPEVLARQFEFERPAQIAAAERQQQFALKTQQPAEQALQNLAQPLLPVGTGIAANADEQARLNGLQKKSQDLQDELNAGYAQGRQILATTYQVPLQLLNQIAGVGQQIAGLQAGISNEAAAYQTAQYNFQLQIARRTLSDIGGLTGKNFGAGESYLGVLERQNLALSRQAQLLQFALAQRQINFQQAVAGFQAPGVTPEERQANVKEAQIEADYAQKQLDIQRQMFGNQVQIVDIQNLRQGADLAKQIGLLLQGRQLTLDTAAAQEQINLLQVKQSQLVAQAGTYLTKVNSLTSVAFSQIQQLEAAAGKAMAETAVNVLESFGLVLTGLTNRLNQFNGISDSRSEGNSSIVGHASGYVGTTSGKTMTGVGYMGEAGSEAYAILRNPKALSGGLGGGGDINITFGDVYVRDDGDIGKIVTRVMQAIGTRASLAGLRLNG